MWCCRAVHKEREQRKTERRLQLGKEARMKYEDELKEQRKKDVLKVLVSYDFYAI